MSWLCCWEPWWAQCHCWQTLYSTITLFLEILVNSLLNCMKQLQHGTSVSSGIKPKKPPPISDSNDMWLDFSSSVRVSGFAWFKQGAASPVPWWHWRCWRINLQSLFNKDHYIIFNLTVNVFCNADISRHICLDGLKPQTKPCVGGLATTKWFNSALMPTSGQRGKVILWPKATNILHIMSFTFLSSLEILSMA